MRNVTIFAKSTISIPDDAIIDDGRIIIKGKEYKDISISVSCYENDICADADILETEIVINEINDNTKIFQNLI